MCQVHRKTYCPDCRTILAILSGIQNHSLFILNQMRSFLDTISRSKIKSCFFIRIIILGISVDKNSGFYTLQGKD